ncbi:MAG TPA: NAD(P)-dependent oxidoreductase [Acidimicrobiia bacterium]|nr:NAD(P)-dependent oxidoreductase [Acidimicrobiia bacterium]
MRIFFTGATGVIGREAIPRLVETGHSVTVAVRPSSDIEWLASHGVDTVEVDLFDPEAVGRAVDGHEAVFHFATAIPGGSEFTKRRAWSMNDRLRTDATRYLVDAAIDARVSLFVQEGVSLVYADGRDSWLDESASVAPVWDVLDSALDAEREVGRFASSGGKGVVLRMGRLYGPGKVSGDFLQGVTSRRVPLVGSGGNFISHLHVADAGRAVVAALDVPPGVYNVGDGSPVTAAENLDLLTGLLGAPAPRRIPPILARRMVGAAANMLTVSHRVSADRFRTASGWVPEHPSVRTGWPEVVAAEWAAERA